MSRFRIQDTSRFKIFGNPPPTIELRCYPLSAYKRSALMSSSKTVLAPPFLPLISLLIILRALKNLYGIRSASTTFGPFKTYHASRYLGTLLSLSNYDAIHFLVIGGQLWWTRQKSLWLRPLRVNPSSLSSSSGPCWKLKHQKVI